MAIPLYIWLALASALCLGCYSLAVKLLLRYRVCSPLLITLWTSLAAGALSLPVLAALHPGVPLRSAPALAGLVAATISSHLLLSIALQEADASTAVPLLGLKIPFTAVLSAVFFRELYPPVVYLAVVLSAASVMLFGVGRPAPAVGGRGRHAAVGIGLSVLAALSYSVADLFARQALRDLNPWHLILWANVLVGAVCGGLLLLPRFRVYRLGRLEYGGFVLNALLLTGGIALFFASMNVSGLITIPNIILAVRGFIALAAGFAFNRFLHIHIERQTATIYLLRTIGAVLLFVSLSLIILQSR